MKLTFKRVNKKPRAKYPYFGIFQDCGVKWIVLFTSYNDGVLVLSEEAYASEYVPGHVSKKWGEDDFTPFYGTITIEED